MKLFGIAVGLLMGGGVGLVMAQSVDLLPALIIGAIMGGSTAFGSSTISTKKEHCTDQPALRPVTTTTAATHTRLGI